MSDIRTDVSSNTNGITEIYAKGESATNYQLLTGYLGGVVSCLLLGSFRCRCRGFISRGDGRRRFCVFLFFSR